MTQSPSSISAVQTRNNQAVEVEIPATTILRPVEIRLDGDGDDAQACRGLILVHPSQAERRQRVNCNWSTTLPPCFMTRQAKSRSTSYLPHGKSLTCSLQVISCNHTHTSIYTDLYIYACISVGVTRISIHFCGWAGGSTSCPPAHSITTLSIYIMHVSVQ